MTIIRKANANDAARCAEIYAPYVQNTWISFEASPPDAREMDARIATAQLWLVVEDAGGHVCGYAYAAPHRTREAYARSSDVTVYVDEAHARKGFGRALYGELLAGLARMGQHAAFAGIALPNAASVALHEAMGFSPIGVYREVGWKLGGWRDVGWWQRLL